MCPPSLEDIREHESLSAAKRNCLVCNGVGTNLCSEHREDVLNGVPAGIAPINDCEFIDLCRVMALGPLGVY